MWQAIFPCKLSKLNGKNQIRFILEGTLTNRVIQSGIVVIRHMELSQVQGLWAKVVEQPLEMHSLHNRKCSWKFPVGYFIKAHKSTPQDSTKNMPNWTTPMTNHNSQVNLFLSIFNILKFYSSQPQRIVYKKERFANAQY